MEFWLTYNDREEVFQFPVPPKEFTISKGTQISTVNINSIGEIALIGKGVLATLAIESFFPARYYPFCQYSNIQSPYDSVRLIEKWQSSGKSVRFLITETSVNLPVTIEKFNYGERGGTRDVYFSLALKEYRFVSVRSDSARAADRSAPETYTVKAGDTPLVVAKRIYGDSEQAPMLLARNGVAEIKPGMVLAL